MLMRVSEADAVLRVAEPADMEGFLRSVERRGFMMARVSLGNEDDALDVVQDTMLRLVQRYANRPPAEWRPLFYRILQNRIADLHRRRRIGSWFGNLRPGAGAEDDDSDPIQELPDPAPTNPERLVAGERRGEALLAAIATLPERQRQAFMLRCWEGLSTEETARAMGCSEGSVKTHYFRALQVLRDRLGEHWP